MADNREENKPQVYDKYKSVKDKILELQAQLEELEMDQQTRADETGPIKTIYRWEAPNRVFSAKSRNWYVYVSLLFMLGIAFATISKEYLLVIVLVLMMFITYLINSIKPHIVEHEVTNKGIKSGNKLWLWGTIKGFWISRRGSHWLVLLDLIEAEETNRIMLLLGAEDPKKMTKMLIRHIPYLSYSQIGEDFVNVFTTGEYQPITKFIEREADTPAAEDKKAELVDKKTELRNEIESMQKTSPVKRIA